MGAWEGSDYTTMQFCPSQVPGGDKGASQVCKRECLDVGLGCGFQTLDHELVAYLPLLGEGSYNPHFFFWNFFLSALGVTLVIPHPQYGA